MTERLIEELEQDFWPKGWILSTMRQLRETGQTPAEMAREWASQGVITNTAVCLSLATDITQEEKVDILATSYEVIAEMVTKRREEFSAKAAELRASLNP